MRHFDPLLFNGLGSERERRWNHILYSIVSINGALSILTSLCILNGIVRELYYYTWFLISYVIFILIFLTSFIVWLYIHILIFKYTKQNKHIDKSNPLLICEYQGSFKNYCVWTLGFIAVFILCLILFILSFIASPFFIAILFLLYLYKPFLLKRILLFEEYVILEYRIFGNMKLSREGLALMAIPRPAKNLAFVRPQLFDKDKYPHIIANYCTRFNPFGMTNVDILRQELDSKMGYSAYEMTKDRYVLNTDIKNWNCLKTYL